MSRPNRPQSALLVLLTKVPEGLWWTPPRWWPLMTSLGDRIEPATVRALVAHGWAEWHPTLGGGAGRWWCRITDTGRAHLRIAARGAP